MDVSTGLVFGFMLIVALAVVGREGYRFGVKTERKAIYLSEIEAAKVALRKRAALAADHSATPEPKKYAPQSVAQLRVINMGAIIQIESSGNPNAESPVGCRGLCQIAKDTWYECTDRMGVAWSWDDDAWDPGCNRAVGNYYLNKRIPAMLNHYGIQDTIQMRLGAYNWGIGNLVREWNQHGHGWINHAPQETVDYIRKYSRIMVRKTQH